MANKNLNQQKAPTGENKPTPPPPAPQISIRTMESDIKAIEQGGGEMAAPQRFTPSGFQLDRQSGAAEEEKKLETGLNVPGYSGPEKAIFPPQSVPPQPRPTIEKPQGFNIEPTRSGPGALKTILIILGILVIIIGFGLLGYFVVSSWIFPKQMPPVQ